MQSLTKGDLIKIHDDLVKISSEELDILSEYKLDKIVFRHKKAKTLVKKAAVLLPIYQISNLLAKEINEPLSQVLKYSLNLIKNKWKLVIRS